MSIEEWVPGNKSELMLAISREWNLLMEVIDKLVRSDKLMTPDESGWSPKDNLAHLTEWMSILIGYHMDHLPPHEVLGVLEDVTKDWDFNVINDMLFKRNKERTIDDVLDEMKRVYGDLVSRLESMSFDDLLAPRQADDPEKRPLLLWVIGNTSEHFAEHRETIEKLL
ncbi:MAG TPA: ClbS/DfsB family four-helix bundle protein [Anaerolineales bacterium]|nr:ClbS/DfsB family four-helix bundle protein [Anaerolineales bacterium]